MYFIMQNSRSLKEAFDLNRDCPPLSSTLQDLRMLAAVVVCYIITKGQSFHCSGLKVNYTKTEGMWIGSCRNNTETPLALKWCKTVKALGVHFSYNNEESVQKNFYDKLKEIKSQICLWSWRGLSLFGKVTIIKSLLLLMFYTLCQFFLLLWSS